MDSLLELWVARLEAILDWWHVEIISRCLDGANDAEGKVVPILRYWSSSSFLIQLLVEVFGLLCKSGSMFVACCEGLVED